MSYEVNNVRNLEKPTISDIVNLIARKQRQISKSLHKLYGH